MESAGRTSPLATGWPTNQLVGVISEYLVEWCLFVLPGNILMLNCLVLSGLIVSEDLKKSSPNVTIFFAKFQSQFDSPYFS